VGEELVGVTVGLSVHVVNATGLHVVLQELRGGKGHNEFTKQSENKQRTFSFNF
jgi:hypothetical protein